MIDSTGAPPGCDGATRRTAMTTIPENDPPRGADGVDPTTETEEDERFA